MDDINKRSLRSMLNGDIRNDDAVLMHFQKQPHVDEFIRPQGRIFVVEYALKPARASRGIDHVVNRKQGPSRQLGLVVAGIGLYLKRPLAQTLRHSRKIIFGKREQDSNRFELGYDQQAVGIGGVNHVAGINQPQSDAPVDGRSNVAITELKFCIINLCLVGADSSLLLVYQGLLRINLLPGDDSRRQKTGEAIEIQFGVVELGLVFEQLRLGLAKLHLKGTRINHRQQITFSDGLSFFESDGDKLPIYPAPDIDGIRGSHGPQPSERDRQILQRDFRHANRNRPVRRRTSPLFLLRRGSAAATPHQQTHESKQEKRYDLACGPRGLGAKREVSYACVQHLFALGRGSDALEIPLS